MVFNLRVVQHKLDLAIREIQEIENRIRVYDEQLTLIEQDLQTEWQPPADGSFTPAQRLFYLNRSYQVLEIRRAAACEQKRILEAAISEYRQILATYGSSPSQNESE